MLYNIIVILKNGVSEYVGVLLVGYLYIMFLLIMFIMRNLECFIMLDIIIINGGIFSYDEIMNVGGMEYIMIFINCDFCYYYFKFIYMRDIIFFCIFFY